MLKPTLQLRTCTPSLVLIQCQGQFGTGAAAAWGQVRGSVGTVQGSLGAIGKLFGDSVESV